MGFQLGQRKRHGASTRSEFLFPSLLLSFHVAFYYFLFFSTPVLFHLLGARFVEKGGCSPGRGPKVGDGSPTLGGLWFRMEAAVAGSEVEGFYGLLRGAMSHSSMSSSPPPPKKVCHTLFATRSHPPPQESQEPEAPGPAEQTPESTSLTVPSVLEGEIPANMQPLCIQLGGIKRVYRCQVEGCREGPSTSHATICAHIYRVHLGVGFMCPLCNKSFFNHDTFRCHKKGHLNL